MAYYATKQAILDEAGLLHAQTGETLNGNADGSNKTFVTNYKPLADSNDDDLIDASDVSVYVNGSPVAVSAVVPTTGSITLVNAPANGASVTCDYRSTNVTDSYLTNLRDEAQDWVNSAMDGIDPTPYTIVPPTVRKLTRQYAAAMLLIKDYGSNQDTKGTSKDGYARLKMVQDALDKYIAIGGNTGLPDSDAGDLSVITEPSLFDAYDVVAASRYTVDEFFMRDVRDVDLP